MSGLRAVAKLFFSMKQVALPIMKNSPLLTGQRFTNIDNESIFGGWSLPSLLWCFCYKRAKPDGSDEMAKLGDTEVCFPVDFTHRNILHLPGVTEECFYSKSQITELLSRPQKSFSEIRLWVKRKNGFWASALEASDNTSAYQALIREDARNTWKGLTLLTFSP